MYRQNIGKTRIHGTHVPEEFKKKFDDQSEKFIFIGYSDVSKVYHLYNPISKKLIISRDVEFK